MDNKKDKTVQDVIDDYSLLQSKFLYTYMGLLVGEYEDGENNAKVIKVLDTLVPYIYKSYDDKWAFNYLVQYVHDSHPGFKYIIVTTLDSKYEGCKYENHSYWKRSGTSWKRIPWCDIVKIEENSK